MGFFWGVSYLVHTIEGYVPGKKAVRSSVMSAKL